MTFLVNQIEVTHPSAQTVNQTTDVKVVIVDNIREEFEITDYLSLPGWVPFSEAAKAGEEFANRMTTALSPAYHDWAFRERDRAQAEEAGGEQ